MAERVNNFVDLLEKGIADGLITPEEEAFLMQERAEAVEMGLRSMVRHQPGDIARTLSFLEPRLRLAGLAPEDRLAGLAPEDIMAGLKPEDIVAGLSEEQQATLAALLAKSKPKKSKKKSENTKNKE